MKKCQYKDAEEEIQRCIKKQKKNAAFFVPNK